MNDQQPQKAVYKEGSSVADIVANNEAAATNPTVEPPITSTTAAVNPEGKLESVAAGGVDVPTPNSDDSASVTLSEIVVPDAPSDNGNAQPKPTEINWKDAIKGVDKKDLYAELGINAFALELNDHIRNGGDAADYLAAKSVDFNKVTDEDLIKSDLRAQYPQFTNTEITRLFNRKYGITEEMSDDEKDDKSLELKAAAHTMRQQKIAEQQKFKIAAPIEIKTQENFDGEMQKILAEEQKRAAESTQWFNNHEATKAIMENKRVVVPLGDMGNFNFNVDKPEVLMRAITDPNYWQRITSTNPGEPDANKLVPNVALMQKLSLMAHNPNYERDLVNYGKSLKLKELQDEGKNIGIPPKVIPSAVKQTEREAWRTAKSSTVGS